MPGFQHYYLVSLLLFFPLDIGCQTEPCEYLHPDFKIQKIEIEKSFKNKSIIGFIPGGKVLIKTSDARGSRYFWINKKEKPVEVKFTQPVTGLASLDGRVIYCTIENQKGLFKIVLDPAGNPVSTEEFRVPGWSDDILQPHIFQLSIADYPALIFSAKAKGRDNYDLYVSEIRNSGWTEPKPLDNPEINDAYNQSQPTVSPEGILVFSSDRPGSDCESVGNNDLWFALPDTRLFWQTAPVNPLPAPINSRSSEFSLAAWRDDFGAGFFTSDRGEGRQTLYFFEKDSLCCDMEPVDLNCCPFKPRYFALLIGVNRYDSIEQQLEWPLINMRELKSVLSDKYCFEVDTLENPVKATVMDKLSKYQDLNENDYLLISFFGHGLPYPGVNNATSSRLALRDSKPDFSHSLHPDEFLKSLYSIRKPRHIFMILDACFSGLFKPQNYRGVMDESKLESRSVCSSTAGWFTPDNSIFFVHLLHRLSNGLDNPSASMLGSTLCFDIKQKMSASNGNENTATYEPFIKEMKGDFPFPKPCRY
jgi:hypothetical protein